MIAVSPTTRRVKSSATSQRTVRVTRRRRIQTLVAFLQANYSAEEQRRAQLEHAVLRAFSQVPPHQREAAMQKILQMLQTNLPA